MEQQMAGEESVPTFIQSSGATPTLKEAMDTKGYFKTTSMANFYYRKTGSYGNFPRSRSAEGLADMASDGSVDSKESVTNKTTRHARRKSKSHTDLNLSFK